MKKVLVLLRLMIPILHRVLGDMDEKWEVSSQANAEIVNKRRRAVIPDETRFQDRIVATSSEAYKASLAPDFVSKRGSTAQEIINRQTANLSRSYKKYREHLDYAYETVDGVACKRFKERIKAAREHYATGAGEKVIPFSGSRVYGPSVMTIVPAWLTKDPQVAGKLREGDELVGGGPLLVCPREHRSAFRAALASRLQQAGAAIVDSKYDAQIMKRHNDITNELIQTMVDSDLGLAEFATEGDSYVNFMYKTERSGLYLEIKVTKQ